MQRGEPGGSLFLLGSEPGPDILFNIKYIGIRSDDLPDILLPDNDTLPIPTPPP
jgi:hypothetical protein